MRISIDSPNTQMGTLSGAAAIGGWAIDDTAAIGSVAVSVDGVSFGNAAYGGSRPDVCNIFANRAGCPNVGWNFLLDTTMLPDGTHTLEINGTSTGGQHSTVTVTFTVANQGGTPILIAIDRPSSTGTLSGVVVVGGWAIDTNGLGIAGTQILVDGVALGPGGIGSRPDVCALYGNPVGCPNVGWDFLLDTTVLANGAHTFEVQAASTAGQRATTSTLFNVANTP